MLPTRREHIRVASPSSSVQPRSRTTPTTSNDGSAAETPDSLEYRKRAPSGDAIPRCTKPRTNASLTITVRAAGLKSPPWKPRPATIGRSKASKKPGPTDDCREAGLERRTGAGRDVDGRGPLNRKRRPRHAIGERDRDVASGDWLHRLGPPAGLLACQNQARVSMTSDGTRSR